MADKKKQEYLVLWREQDGKEQKVTWHEVLYCHDANEAEVLVSSLITDRGVSRDMISVYESKQVKFEIEVTTNVLQRKDSLTKKWQNDI